MASALQMTRTVAEHIAEFEAAEIPADAHEAVAAAVQPLFTQYKSEFAETQGAELHAGPGVSIVGGGGVFGNTRSGTPVLSVTEGGASMQFSMDIKGDVAAEERGVPLFICLHGGGQGDGATNDDQFGAMQNYWLSPVEVGIYVACRGITNTWKLHWEDASFRLYDRIIERCIALGNVDSNRVYVMGYSCGGDGVYRLVPGMPDRWAAGNMCAGHCYGMGDKSGCSHGNNVSFVNMQHVPMLLQVGELDTAFDRHVITVRNGRTIQQFQDNEENNPLHTGYLCEARVHVDAEHSYIKDWGQSAPLVENNDAWESSGGVSGSGGVVEVTCDSVAWVLQHVRNPTPRHIIWEPVGQVRTDGRLTRSVAPPFQGVVKERSLEKFCRWLDISRDNVGPVVEVIISRGGDMNVIEVLRCGQWLRLLLDERLVNLEAPVTVYIGSGSDRWDSGPLTLNSDPEACNKVRWRTLCERGDPAYCFSHQITLARSAGQWAASTSADADVFSTTGAGVRELAVGDKVVAKFVGFRGQESNPWFAGTVESIDIEGGTAIVVYEDGDRCEDVLSEEIMYAPDRPADWGKGDNRGNDLLPMGAIPVSFLPVEAAAHLLAVGDRVVAKFVAYRGQDENPWFAGTIEDIQGSTANILYEDGDRCEGVLAEEIMYAPDRPADWGKGDNRGNDLLPVGSMPVRFLREFVSENETGDSAAIIALFKQADADNDGTISIEELKAVFGKIAGDFTEEDFQALFEGSDRNGDGVLQYEEFVEWLMSG